MNEDISTQTIILKEKQHPAITIISLVLGPIATVVSAFLGFRYVGGVIQSQTQVVIEPRDGDIIVEEGSGYKLLQLLTVSDIYFPTKIQEIRRQSDIPIERVDVNNDKNEDWSDKDGFQYMIDEISFNSNKIINLLGSIKNITLFVDFYAGKNISTKIELGKKQFEFEIYDIETNEFKITNTNISSNYVYVTNEVNNGFEWAKVRLEIEYLINEKIINDKIVSNWMETDADII